MSTNRNAAAAERNKANETRKFLLTANHKPIETTLVTDCWMLLHALKGGE